MRRVLLPLGIALGLAGPVVAQSASRDLPDSYRPSGPAQTVTITLAGTGAVTAAGVEDQPPTGWIISNISNSGIFDVQSGKVKWGPFFSPSIPATLTYQIVAPANASGEACFAGTASFDGLDEAIGGEQCIPPPVPATSAVGLVVLGGSMLAMGGVMLRRRRRVPFC